ncbi:MAG: TetR/AcrR family transcriptional regulator [Balneolaceae bacterium]
MGIKDRKERERNRRKEHILNAAIELIKEQGFDETTMDDIAKRAEFSKGTLYLYFNDKSSLHQAIKKKALTQIRDEYLAIIQDDLKGSEIVGKMVSTFLEFVTQSTPFTKSMMLYEQTINDNTDGFSVFKECSQIENELFMLIIRAIQIGVQDESIKSNTAPKILAIQIGFQMRGILHFYQTGPQEKVQQILNENNMKMTDLMMQFLKSHFD